jgi:RNA polymerase sigma factor (sigma-70 family)
MPPRLEGRAMTESQLFARLMERMRSGCPDAARELFDRYSPHIRKAVRRRLHQRLRTQYDSLDFTQAVWASFFAVPPDRHTFNTPDDLLGFLAQVASNKVTEVFRQRLQTDKYNLNREVPLGEDDRERPAEPRAGQPTPSQVAMANERWERLLAGQPDHFRRVLELRRQGHTHQEIARQLGVTTKVIQRLLRKLDPTAEHP